MLHDPYDYTYLASRTTPATGRAARPTEFPEFPATSFRFEAVTPPKSEVGAESASSAEAREAVNLVVLSFTVVDVRKHNRQAWDKAVEMADVWTRPVSSEVIEAARRGDWEIFLTECKPMPRDWLPEPKGKRILCLTSAGGQQAPLLAAAGADVTSFDNSPRQLLQDRFVAERDGLELETVEGDMRDLSVFGDASFDVVVHACSNLFVPDVNPVWQECYRVLRPGGMLLAGFLNPMEYIFDPEREDEGFLEVRYSLPFSDVSDLPPEVLEKRLQKGDPLEFSHSLDDQLGGQLAAGFVLTGLYESHRERGPKSKMFPSYIATRALKAA